MVNQNSYQNFLVIRYRIAEGLDNFEISETQFIKKVEEKIRQNISDYGFLYKTNPRIHDNCVICWTENANYLLIPCGHRALCGECKEESYVDGYNQSSVQEGTGTGTRKLIWYGMV